ncbi:MAG: hypothetical protein J5J06_19355 [Phycisphaerae bacterium]|nr:hypothetical protein [Phycisphaerae bacterium]
MAKVQQGVGAITVWMIVFVALWLTSTVFLVVLYTGQEELKNENQRLSDDVDRLITSSQRNAIPQFQEAKPGGPTLAGLLEDARRQTAEIATGGEGGDNVATVRTKRDELVKMIERDRVTPDSGEYAGLSLLQVSRKLYESLKSSQLARTAAENRVAELEGQVDQQIQTNLAQKTEFEKRAQEMAGQVEEVETSRAAFRREQQEAKDKLQRDFEQRLQQNDTVLAQVRQSRATLEEENRELQERFRAQQAKFSELLVRPEELGTARKPDGMVLTAIPGDEVVYINLGRKDRLTLGLQFTVYTAEDGIPASGRGKARIEVVSMEDTSAECRKVWVDPRQVVLEGDLIANPVYDADRALSFAVAGAFDLDHDGTPDPNGADIIEALIENWGGKLVSEPTALTDFVVLGAEPRKPRTTINPSAEEAERARRMQEAVDRYERVVTTANNLAIPVLPQEVFLNFLGYSGGQRLAVGY